MSSRVPRYLRQKRSPLPDAAYTRIDGKRIYLGLYNSPDSRAKYAELLKGTTFCGLHNSAEDPTVNELLVVFLDYAKTYYSDPREHGHFYAVAKLLRRHAGNIRAAEFGPKRLKAIREAMIAKGWTRKAINRQIVRVRQIFKWGVGEELVPAVNLEALKAVSGLRAGRSKAAEKPTIRAVSSDDVDATLPHLPTLVADMVRVHKLIGCRPAELVNMRPDEINRGGKVWFYEPQQHKNEWRGKPRSIAIGPRAQAIIKKYLFGEWCFQTVDRQPYLVVSYRRSITRACNRAGVEPWTPGQLRHSTASLVRKEFGLDSAQLILGHSTANTTEIYAELDKTKAAEVALRIG